MTSVAGKVAAITGAGSGIGRALAVELARRGARVAISDRDLEPARETARLVTEAGGEAICDALDVTDGAAVDAYAARVADWRGVVHQIYNNAGIAHSDPVLESEYADYERVLAVNLMGVIHGTKAFLPHLIASRAGHVINVSSLNGLMAQDEMTHYCASKFAVRGFSESLRIEMLRGHHPVRVTVVHPGGVKTAIADHAHASAIDRGRTMSARDERRLALYNEKLLRLPAGDAARIIVDGIEAGRGRIVFPRDARVLDRLIRLMPASYPRAIARLADLVDRP